MTKPCRYPLPTLKISYSMVALLLVSCILARMETAAANQASGAKLSAPRGWKTYTDPLHRFRISYPSDYERAVNPADPPGMIRVQHRRLDARIVIYASDEPFDLQEFVKQAPTGAENPPGPVQAGGKTFYYYGAGGGGVSYPDEYFFNLRGKTLTVVFDGPYINDKSPSKETKALEPVVLASLRVF